MRKRSRHGVGCAVGAAVIDHQRLKIALRQAAGFDLRQCPQQNIAAVVRRDQKADARGACKGKWHRIGIAGPERTVGARLLHRPKCAWNRNRIGARAGFTRRDEGAKWSWVADIVYATGEASYLPPGVSLRFCPG